MLLTVIYCKIVFYDKVQIYKFLEYNLNFISILVLVKEN